MKNTFLFDFDGTVADSMPFWHNNDDEFMISHGITPTPELHERLWALTADEVADFYIDTLGIKSTPEQIINESYELMNKHYENDIKTKPGIEKVLTDLKNKNYKTCIVTVTKEATVRKFLKIHNLENKFDEVFSCDSVGIIKSDPKLYEYVAEKLNSKYEEMVFVEDSLYAINAAKPLGITSVGIYEEMAKDHWDEMKEVADYTMMDFNDWPNELK